MDHARPGGGRRSGVIRHIGHEDPGQGQGSDVDRSEGHRHVHRGPRTSTTTSTNATTTSAGRSRGSRAPTATTPAAKVCVDEVGVLGSALCAKVTAVLDADEQLTTDEVAVLVVDTTGDETIEHYATRTFNSWGIGKADKNNGVLLLVAVDDRALRIEVGSGLEQTLTDGEAEEIIYGTITPEFKAGDYRGGILAGLDAIRTHLRHRVTTANALAGLSGDSGSDDPPRTGTSRYQYAYDSADEDEDETSSSNGSAVLWIVLLVVLMVGSWAWSAYRRGNGDDDDSPGRLPPAVPLAGLALLRLQQFAPLQWLVEPVVGPVRLRRRTLPRRRRQRFLVSEDQKVIWAVRPCSARTGMMIFPNGTNDTGIILKLADAQRDPDDGDAQSDSGDQMGDGQPQAGEDEPDDVADQRRCPGAPGPARWSGRTARARTRRSGTTRCRTGS